MAFTFAKTYDFKKNKIVIGGHVVQGFGDDSGIEYEPVSEKVETTYGLDGEATFSKQNIKGIIATITLKETSNSVAVLSELRRAQFATTKIQPLPFNHIDLVTGDKVKSTYCVFKNQASPSKARNAGERTFVLELPYAADDIREGTTNILPV